MENAAAIISQFEVNPTGVVEWRSHRHKPIPRELIPRLAACVRAEARIRVQEAEAGK
jgi:hypothetical protein